MRVADVDTCATGRDVERRPVPAIGGSAGRRAHVDARPRLAVSAGDLDVDPAQPRVGRRSPAVASVSPRLRSTALGETADAVAAHLGAAAVGVVEPHLDVAGVRRTGAPPMMRPSAPMPGWRSQSRARAARHRPASGRRRRVNNTRKSLPSPWCLLSVHQAAVSQDAQHRLHLIRRIGLVEPRDPRVAAEPAPWRTGESAGARVIARRSRRRDRCHLADARAARDSRAPRRGAGEAAGRAASAATSSRNPAAICASKRSRDALGEDRSRQAQADLGDLGRVGSVEPGPEGREGRPLPSDTSSARTTRRRFVGVMREAATGSISSSRRVERGDVALPLELLAHRRPLARMVRDDRRPPGGRGRCRPRATRGGASHRCP